MRSLIVWDYNKNMKILSLFDGVSCARVACERAGIDVEAYIACEIDKYAIQVSQKNWPEIKQMGSVVGHSFNLDIDLLIGGSPCQDLSIAKKNRKGLDGERSGLFWEYVRILKEVKPKYFILENVNSMPKEAKALITETLGVEPVMINASLVSAQNRKRLFWCGQTRERLYFNDVYCYDCLYENERISPKTQNKRKGEVLGEAQKGYNDLQSVPFGISENQSQRNDKDMFNGVSGGKQKTKRQETGQERKGEIQQGLHNKEQEETFGISKDISPVKDRQGENENSRQSTSQKNNQTNENTLSTGNNRDKKENNEGGSNGNPQHETDMCCVQCNKRFDDRPFNTFIERRNERFTEPTSLMSEVQFNEARQNNGRVFDVYKINITQPEDRGILLKDILEENVDEKYNVHSTNWRVSANLRDINGKSKCLNASNYKGALNDGMSLIPVTSNGSEKLKSNTVRTGGRGSGINDKHNWDTIRIGQIGKGGQGDRIYSPEGKSVGLSALGGGRGAKTGLYAVALTETRTEEAKAIRRENMKNGRDYSPRREKELVPRKDEKANTITTGQTKESLIIQDTQIRKLTPIECERLQGLPDNYTDGISNSQRYKCCGNAFNVDVVAHILSFIPR